jgi:hypothetical protein
MIVNIQKGIHFNYYNYPVTQKPIEHEKFILDVDIIIRSGSSILKFNDEYEPHFP